MDKTEIIGKFQVDKYGGEKTLFSVYLPWAGVVLASYKTSEETIKRLNDLRNEIYRVMEWVYNESQTGKT